MAFINFNKAYKYILIIILDILLITINNSKNDMGVSIIIPVYNRKKLIRRSVESALNQTYKNIEIIVVDDGSKKNIEEEIDKIGDKRIKYIRLSKNKGACYARNIGIKYSDKEYITFLDSDDKLHPKKLETQMNNIIKHKSNFDFCKLMVNNNKHYIIPNNSTEKEIYKGNILNELVSKGNFISTQSIIVKKSIIEKYLFDNELLRLQDYDLVLRMFPSLKISFTNKTLANLYVQKDSITNNRGKLKSALKRIFNKSEHDYYILNRNQKKNFTKYLKNLYKSYFGKDLK